MKRVLSGIIKYIRKSDMFLLTLCIVSTLFGIVLISSASQGSHARGSERFVLIQSASLLLGIGIYWLFSAIDIDILADKWKILLVFSVLFILSLIPFGVEGDTGNKAWLRFAGIGIQPAEVVKIPFIIMLAKQIIYLRESPRGLNHILSVPQMVLHLGLFFGMIVVISGDLGSALVYCFIFIIMIFVGGLKIRWFALAGGLFAVIAPYLWSNFLNDNQRIRIQAVYDSSIDPTGLGITFQASQSKIAIASGQITGQGLYHGTKTQSGIIPAQHNDFIFSVVGEEFGMIGCLVVFLLLMLIIIRCVYIGIKCNNRLGMLVCFGIAGMLTFQTFENIGMCLGIAPVIGLALPFFSYGGSSIITLFAAMGIVCGIKMRPAPSQDLTRW